MGIFDMNPDSNPIGSVGIKLLVKDNLPSLKKLYLSIHLLTRENVKYKTKVQNISVKQNGLF